MSNDYPLLNFYSLAVGSGESWSRLCRKKAECRRMVEQRRTHLEWCNGVINQLPIPAGTQIHLCRCRKTDWWNHSIAVKAGASPQVSLILFMICNSNLLTTMCSYALVRTGNFIEFRISTDNGQSFTPSWTDGPVKESMSPAEQDSQLLLPTATEFTPFSEQILRRRFLYIQKFWWENDMGHNLHRLHRFYRKL